MDQGLKDCVPDNAAYCILTLAQRMPTGWITTSCPPLTQLKT